MATSVTSATLVETVPLDHLPSSHQIHIALYRNITNASFLHEQLLAGNTAFEYALIDASVVSLSFPAPCQSHHIPISQKLYGHVMLLECHY
jgi:hypothetical protein